MKFRNLLISAFLFSGFFMPVTSAQQIFTQSGFLIPTQVPELSVKNVEKTFTFGEGGDIELNNILANLDVLVKFDEMLAVSGVRHEGKWGIVSGLNDYIISSIEKRLYMNFDNNIMIQVKPETPIGDHKLEIKFCSQWNMDMEELLDLPAFSAVEVEIEDEE